MPCGRVVHGLSANLTGDVLVRTRLKASHFTSYLVVASLAVTLLPNLPLWDQVRAAPDGAQVGRVRAVPRTAPSWSVASDGAQRALRIQPVNERQAVTIAAVAGLIELGTAIDPSNTSCHRPTALD